MVKLDGGGCFVLVAGPLEGREWDLVEAGIGDVLFSVLQAPSL